MIDFILNNSSSVADVGIIDFINKFKNDETITFSTSGTTGVPKIVKHTAFDLAKNIKTKDDLRNSVWGLTYDYSKIAGSQVILQSYLNGGKLVNLFNKPIPQVEKLLEEHSVTHISATPTFYRMLSSGKKFYKIKQATLGGETVDSKLIDKIKSIFPNSKVTNVYALTEFGTILASNHEYFEISEDKKNIIRIENGRIFIKTENLWFDTGDTIEWIDQNRFLIVGRESNMINVGGIKVNPMRIESVVNSLGYVLNSFVYGRKNSITGYSISCDIILQEETSINQIRNDLILLLEKHEVPSRINIVEKINLNSTGKISRI